MAANSDAAYFCNEFRSRLYVFDIAGRRSLHLSAGQGASYFVLAVGEICLWVDFLALYPVPSWTDFALIAATVSFFSAVLGAVEVAHHYAKLDSLYWQRLGIVGIFVN